MQDVYIYIPCGLYYKNITIVNDTSEVVKMMLQDVVSPAIVILMTLEVSFILLDNIFSTGITHDDRHLQLSYCYSTVHYTDTAI